ncbi:MAG: 2Fe-2S iron-sulfur cluster-binding protein [Thermodesulfobacteriota bacterium]|jgi:succinate dehydrogenase/fumarate reductase-like Fe-S protein
MKKSGNTPQETSNLRILRYDPATRQEPSLQEYHLPFRSGYTVMDGLLHIHEHIDGTLAFRASCQAGLCLACLVMIDGRTQCPCRTLLRGQMKLEPLKNKKVIRDLVVEEES